MIEERQRKIDKALKKAAEKKEAKMINSEVVETSDGAVVKTWNAAVAPYPILPHIPPFPLP